MPRFCRACGRPLEEPDHELIRYPEGHKHEGKPVKQVVIGGRGRGRFPVRKQRVWRCRVRLVGKSPTTGRRLVPSNPQREAALGMPAYVHEDRLREEH